jgi:hypothetical protein
MLFIVHWSESSDIDEFNVEETMEMVELRLSEPKQIADIVESSESSESKIEELTEDKPLTFGSDSPTLMNWTINQLPKASFLKDSSIP